MDEIDLFHSHHQLIDCTVLRAGLRVPCSCKVYIKWAAISVRKFVGEICLEFVFVAILCFHK